MREVCQTLQRVIDERFDEEIWVRGAISGLNRSSGGHVYFDLVEPGELGRRPEASLPVALFANAKFRVNAILKKSNAMRMEDGVEIRIRGRITFYGPQSRIQLVMSLIDPAFTVGQLEMARARLLAELAAEGLLDANRRLPRPLLPLRIALITSAASAAEADFVNELRLSGHPFDITLLDCRVQGNEAVAMIAAALETAAELDVDVIAIVRGGGARTDLVAFDHADVARAIATSPVPVYVGIGHETDQSVADHVAHASLKTPTACAGALVELVRDFRGRLDESERRITSVANAAITIAQHRIDAASARVGLVAGAGVERRVAHLATMVDRRDRALERGWERLDERLARCSLRTEALDPARSLARGWSITRTADGRLVRSSDDAPDGTVLVTTVAEGTVTSRVGDLR